jgi:hypothetical protein
VFGHAVTSWTTGDDGSFVAAVALGVGVLLSDSGSTGVFFMPSVMPGGPGTTNVG